MAKFEYGELRISERSPLDPSEGRPVTVRQTDLWRDGHKKESWSGRLNEDGVVEHNNDMNSNAAVGSILNRLGEDGWELVTLTGDGGDGTYAVLKRQLA